mgnify:CR=1 FL=1
MPEKINIHDFGGNSKTTLPKELGKLRNLQVLDLRNNNLSLSTIPSEIGQLVSLRKLLLANNKLLSLPPEIKTMKDLIELDVSNNALTALPEEIGDLVTLKRYHSTYMLLTRVMLTFLFSLD